ncbi:MAG: acyltransferase [Fusobacterium sp.]
MILRKIITTILWIFFRMKKVSIVWSIKNNIEWNTKIYNSGKKLIIGKVNIRNNVLINTESTGEMIIEDGCFFNRNCIVSCRNKIIIGKGCIFGPNVCIYDHDHKYDVNGFKNGYTCKEIIIEEGCWIGAGVIILKGTYIGKGSIIGAGAIVKGTYPEKTLIYSVNKIKTRSLR